MNVLTRQRIHCVYVHLKSFVTAFHLPCLLPCYCRGVAHLMADSLARQDGSQGKGEACNKRPVAPLPGLWACKGSPLYHTAVVVWLLPGYPLGCLLQL